MARLILVVLLVVIPVPRVLAGQGASKPDGVTQQPNSNQSKPAPLVPVENAPNTVTGGEKSQDHTSENKQISVVVKNFPVKDWWDKAAICAAWALVFIGGLTFYAIWIQAKETAKAAQATKDSVTAIKEQTTHIETSATAAKMSAEATWRGLRPHIAPKPHGSPPNTLNSLEPRVQIELFNKGATPAYDATYESWIELIVPPFVDFTSNADYFKSGDKMTVYPNHIPWVINVPIRKGLAATEHEDLRKLRKQACVRIRIEFRDDSSQTKPNRFANFGFYVMADGISPLPKYNDSD